MRTSWTVVVLAAYREWGLSWTLAHLGDVLEGLIKVLDI
jgi:hypothetical protein